jgi:hypothetical protein
MDGNDGGGGGGAVGEDVDLGFDFASGGAIHDQNNTSDSMSPEGTSSNAGAASSSKGKLQLPLSCDPPGPGNPPKKLVWVVSIACVRR